MTDISGYNITTGRQDTDADYTRGPQWTETYWGISVRDTKVLSGGMIAAQITAFLFGAGFLVAAFGHWLVVSPSDYANAFSTRCMASAVLIMASYALLTFGNRDGTREFQFDQNMGEVRALVVNRNGSTKSIGQYGLDAFDGLSIVTLDAGTACLTLNRCDGGKGLVIARGNPAKIGALYLRLDRDMLQTNTQRSFAAVNPLAA